MCGVSMGWGVCVVGCVIVWDGGCLVGFGVLVWDGGCLHDGVCDVSMGWGILFLVTMGCVVGHIVVVWERYVGVALSPC